MRSVGVDGAGLVEEEVLDECAVRASADEADVVGVGVDVQLADAVLLSVEVSSVGIGGVADRLEQVAVVGHVDVLREACVPVGMGELIDHARKPVELAGIANQAEVAVERGIVHLRVAAVDAEAVLELVWWNCADGCVAVAGDVEWCAVAVEFTAGIDLSAF